MERRLSAILAADVVGFASHNERDEAGTFERLRAHRKELFEPEIAKHHGRVFKLMGDGLLAEFNSVVEAVECAVALQRGMSERNNGIAADNSIHVRIGINLGDVIIEGEDRHGEGVVIASRLQQLAAPGGIAVSGTVMEHVRRKVPLRFDSLGEQKVKNIAAPVAVYRVPLGAIMPAAKASGQQYTTWIAVAALALLLVAGIGVAWHFAGTATPASEEAAGSAPKATEESLSAAANRSPPETSAPAEQASRPRGQGIPVIIVLPFRDLSGGQIESGLGRGIAEEFLSDLATFPELEVVSATSSFAYAGRPIPEIVQATGAQLVIEGSIRISSDKALIRVQLINGTTDRHLQIAEVEQQMTDLVALQREAARRLSDELAGMTGVLRQEIEKISWSKPDAELTEYDFYIRGYTRHLGGDSFKAREIWQEGLRRFPDSVLLRCKLAFTYWGLSSEAAGFVKEAAKLEKRSRLDEWYWHWASAWHYAHHSDYKRANTEAQQAITMAPYDTLSHAELSQIAARAGDYDVAIAWAKFAATHDPHPKGWYFDNLIDAYDMAGKWPDALKLAEAEVGDPATSKYWYKVLARAYTGTNQLEKAKKAQEMYESLPYPP